MTIITTKETISTQKFTIAKAQIDGNYHSKMQHQLKIPNSQSSIENPQNQHQPQMHNLHNKKCQNNVGKGKTNLKNAIPINGRIKQRWNN